MSKIGISNEELEHGVNALTALAIRVENNTDPEEIKDQLMMGIIIALFQIGDDETPETNEQLGRVAERVISHLGTLDGPAALGRFKRLLEEQKKMMLKLRAAMKAEGVGVDEPPANAGR